MVQAQLPAVAPVFTSRDNKLQVVAELLDSSGEGRTATVMVSAVTGVARVGKTALAVRAAHAARTHGWFPGGVLFIDLHGYDDVPIESAQGVSPRSSSASRLNHRLGMLHGTRLPCR